MPSLQNAMKRCGRSLLDLVYPSGCAVCQEKLPPSEKGGLCPFCLSKIPSGSFRLGEVPHLDSVFCLSPYEGMLREALHALKYGGRQDVAFSLSQRLKDAATKEFTSSSFDWIVPVPLSWEKENDRQFNQSERLARIVAESLSVPISVGNLERIQNNRPQVGLPREKRLKNVRNSFRVKRPSLFSGKRILLIDDVITTGATLSACAKVLRKSGAEKISALTLGGGE